jgi:hypothetical protein
MNKTFCLLTLLCFVVTVQAAQEPQMLVPGKPVEREIAGGQSHTYRLTLEAGQFVHAVVYYPRRVEVVVLCDLAALRLCV